MTTNRRERPAFGLQLACVLLGVTGLVAYAVSKFSSGRAVVLVTAAALLAFFVTLAVCAARARRIGPIVATIAGTLLAALLGTYLVLFPLIYFFQDTIADRTGAFFQPRGISAEAARALAGGDVETLELATSDGIVLSGWLVRNTDADRSPLVIYFDGSGSETAAMIPYARRVVGWSVALVNYRGFSPSTGTPSHAHAFTDAALIYDMLSQRPDIDPDRIVAMGYSLGSGVAVYLAEQRPVAATVLVSPYDSLTLVGLKEPPIYAPLAGIMKRYFNSIARAPAIRTPLLCLIGSADTAVPPARAQALAGAWGGETTVKTYEGEDHSLLLHENSSWADITAFLNAATR